MLKVDLGRLERERRLRIDVEVPAAHPLWENTDVAFHGPVRANLEVQQTGPDAFVRGTLTGELDTTCRRCLVPLRVPLEEEIALVFRRGISPLEAEFAEVYALAEDARELDLGPPLREHILLAAPQFVDCSEACKGLCPRCGTNLNEGACSCTAAEVEDRWAPLRQLKLD